MAEGKRAESMVRKKPQGSKDPGSLSEGISSDPAGYREEKAP